MLIDIVYTWVDGLDPKFIEKKNNYLSESDKIHNLNIRYESINEIYYSIKSVLKFASWINKIYIVTDNQIPPIDDELISSGKVIIIDHTQIIPQEYLPTFFSDVIESYLYNIPNLSEIFLYNNDDFLFLDYIYPSDIYEICENKVKINFINKFNINNFYKNSNEYKLRIINTFNLLEKKTDIKLINNHHTKILRKSTLKLLENDYVNELKELRSNKFRNTTCIQYLFLAINVDNIIYNNNIIENNNLIKEFHFRDYHYDEKTGRISIELLKCFDYNKPAKFCCFNNLKPCMKKLFVDYVCYFLNR